MGVFVTKTVWILVCLVVTQVASKGSSEVSTKVVVAWPISGKKETNVVLEQQMLKAICRIMATKLTKSKIKSIILIWNAENSAF